MTPDTDTRPAGCAVCNPDLARPREEVDAELREELQRSLHIARMGDGYHVIQIPGSDGEPFEAWPGPFESESAASLFRDDLIGAWVGGNPNDACCSYGIYDHFNLAGRLLDFMERSGPGPRELANELAWHKPWLVREDPAEDISDDIRF